MVTCQLSSECVHVHCVGIRWPKPQYWANFDTWGHFVKGGRYRSLLSPLPVRAKFGVLEQTHGMHSRVKFRLDWFIVSSSGGENPQFLPFFWTSAFSVVASSQQSENVEHGSTTTNIPLCSDIKTVSVLQRLCGEIGRTISDVQKRDEQTDKQTKYSTAAGEIRAPPNLAWW